MHDREENACWIVELEAMAMAMAPCMDDFLLVYISHLSFC